MKNNPTKNKPLRYLQGCFQAVKNFWKQQSNWIKIPTYIMAFLVLVAGIMYGLSAWYINKHHDEPLKFGVTFISEYAEYYDLNPQQTLEAIFTDLQIKHVRLVSYWEDIETSPGVYDFSSLDWQFDMAQKYGAEVSLAIGLRQPRWPECHAPTWIHGSNKSYWYPELQKFMTATVNHYKTRTVLDSYQLENEYFLNNFGECASYGFDRERLKEEYSLVKSLDDKHPIILSQASNFFGLPLGEPVPDEYGVSVYKYLYDEQITHNYLNYPLPSWYFTARSALIELIHGKPSVLHELQGEPWGPTDILNMSDEEQFKSMNPEILDERIHYGIDTGFREIYLWGAEWWYWRKEFKNDPSLWNIVKSENAKINQAEY